MAEVVLNKLEGVGRRHGHAGYAVSERTQHGTEVAFTYQNLQRNVLMTLLCALTDKNLPRQWNEYFCVESHDSGIRARANLEDWNSTSRSRIRGANLKIGPKLMPSLFGLVAGGLDRIITPFQKWLISVIPPLSV